MLFRACLAASMCMGVSIYAAPTTQSADPAQTLLERANPADRRDDAARQLVARRDAASREVLLKALEDASDRVAQLAAARAVATGADPNPAYLVPLHLLMGSERTLTEAASQALASYRDNPESLRLLINFASARQQRETDRLLAVRALGSTNYKAAAEFLVSLLLRDDDTARVRNAAADALIEMTGHFELGHDPQLWQDWWGSNANKTDVQWREELQAYQASRYAQTRLQYDQLAGELRSILTRVYDNTPAAQQPALMLSYLRSTSPEIRSIGATIVHNEAMAARPISQEARDQLRSLIGDSSRDVRMAVASALRATNDPAALDALLGQLDKETDPAVKAALAAPIASIGDLSAVPALRKLLADRSVGIATAGASALKELGPMLQKDPALAHAVALDLKNALGRAQAGPGAQGLREAIAESLIPLRDPEMLQTFYELLRERSSTRIRWAALRGLGELQDPKAADTIARYLEDRESGVRLEAVRSLEKTSAIEHADELYRRMNPVDERDASVRDEAWRVVQTTFAKLPAEQMPEWVKRFSADPSRKAAFLKAMTAREDVRNSPARLASAEQDLGNVLMELNQPSDAIVEFRAALDYYASQPSQQVVIERLAESYLQALLKAREYSTAARFAGSILAEKASYQQTVGVLFRNEAKQLLDQQRYADLRTLATSVRTIQPALASRYVEDINSLERQGNAASPTTRAAQ